MTQHPIKDEYLKHHIGIVGKARSGKSVTAKGYVEQLVNANRHVCVIDPSGDWWGLRAEGDGAGLSVLILGGEHGDAEISPESGAQVADFIHENLLPVVVDISEFFKADQIKFMYHFAERIYMLQGKRKSALHLIIDEADQFVPQKLMDGGLAPKLHNRMNVLVRLGGKRGFRVTLITQRPATISKDVLTQIETLVCMRLPGPQDQKAIAEWLNNIVTPKEAKEISNSLGKLPTGTGYICSPLEQRLDKVKFPMCQTFDAGRSPEDGDELLEPKSLASVDVDALTHLFTPPPVDEPQKGAVSPNDARLRDLEAQLKLQTERADSFESRCIQYAQHIDAVRAVLDGQAPVATPVTSPPIASIPKPPPTKKAASNGAPKSEPLVDAAASIWPVRLTWAALCSMTGRKARGGHFNATRKRLIDNGIVSEDAGLVTLQNPPEVGGTIPADLLESNLPEPAAKMFKAIRLLPSIRKEELGEHLGMKPHGGHWNSGLAILRNNNLISDVGGRMQVKPELLGTG